MIKESIAISYAPLIIGTAIIFYKNVYSDPTIFPIPIGGTCYALFR
jgi:hypothetical protein